MNKKILFFKKRRSILLPSFRDTLFGSESKKKKKCFFLHRQKRGDYYEKDG